MEKIGIKLANSEFYPILDHGAPARKRLVVTTVNDGQKSVQIDLYRGEGTMVTDAVYVGSLVVEDIPEGKAGEPDVRLDLELDESDMLKCTAVETETGATQSLRVALETLGEENSYEIPDFDLGEEEAEDETTDSLPEEATSPEEGASLLATAEEVLEGRSRKPLLPWLLAALLLIVAIAVLGWLFFFRSLGERAASAGGEADIARTATELATTPAQGSPSTPASAASTPASSAQTSAIPTASPPAAMKAVAAQSSAKASTEAKAPPTTAGKRYRIKWGDTLWDLAWVYYRDPWLYPRIAKANGIRNPDRILSGTWIVIPMP